MPVPPKDPARRQRRNEPKTARPSTTLALVPPTSPPAPLDRWLVATSDDWSVFWRSELAALVRPEALTELHRLFDLYDERARLATAFRKKRFVNGSKGQPVLNPLAEEIARLDARITPLADRFGLNPKARLAMGLQFGALQKTLEELNASVDDAGEADVETKDDPRSSVVVVADHDTG